MTKVKKVSIIVPCYNQAEYLDEALQSVLTQKFVNWECIIVNDGSQDNTESVVKQWLGKDIRFKYLKKENEGLSAARNSGIGMADGEFILPLDADDRISPDYIFQAIQAFLEDKDLKVVYCKAEKFGSEVGEWELPLFSLYNLSRKNMIFCSSVFRKIDWEAAGGYDIKMIYGWEDWDFWIAILKNGGRVKQLNEVGFYYRTKPLSMLNKISKDNMDYLWNYLSVKHSDFFVQHFGSFQHMQFALEQKTAEFEYKLRSEKFAIDVFCSVFFGFSVFGKYKKS